MKVHNLKIKPCYFNDVIRGIKTFEVRYNDRDFKKGDYIILEEFNNHGYYTGRFITAEIIYILKDDEYLKENYVVLGIKLKLDFGAKTQ